MHHVASERASVARLEGVLVNPLPIRAVNLLVHETMRRLPDVDARTPAQRHVAHAEAVINQQHF